MNTKVEIVSKDDTADFAWEKMWMLKIHHLVVMDGKKLIGVISDRDLGGKKGSSLRKNRFVSDFITESVISAPADATPKKAANLLRGNAIGCLPVVDQGKLVGIITITDLLELIGRGLEKPILKTERRTLHRRGTRDRVHSFPPTV